MLVALALSWLLHNNSVYIQEHNFVGKEMDISISYQEIVLPGSKTKQALFLQSGNKMKDN